MPSLSLVSLLSSSDTAILVFFVAFRAFGGGFAGLFGAFAGALAADFACAFACAFAGAFACAFACAARKCLFSDTLHCTFRTSELRAQAFQQPLDPHALLP
jgi:hypothetical protein